jgi:hypothetical protein
MPELTASNQSLPFRESSSLRIGVQEALSTGAKYGSFLAASMVLAARPIQAQEALRQSMAGDRAIQQRSLNLESQPYTFKSGDLRVLLNPSLALFWNDNVNLSSSPASCRSTRPTR